jgi:hypothetical protein
MSFYVYRIVAPVKLYRHLKLTRPNCHSIPTDILKTFSYYTIFYLCRNTGIWPMYLNFPVFATGVRIFRASNDVGSWVHMNTRKKHKVRNKMAGYCLISYYCRFPWFLKNKRMECTNLVDPHQLLCPWITVVFVLFCIYTPRQSVPKTDCQPRRRSILDSLGLGNRLSGGIYAK